MELTQFVGIAGVPLVVSLVEIIKEFLPKKFSAVYSMVVAVLLNASLAYVLNLNIAGAFVVGIVTGGIASGYYDYDKRNSQ